MKDIVFILGGPGSGKGTLCSNLVKDRNDWVHLSIGDLLRDTVSRRGDKWEIIKKCIDNGISVPDGISEEIMIAKILETDACLFLVDGLPRIPENWVYWKTLTNGLDFRILSIILLECSNDTLVSRIKNRHRNDNHDSAIQVRIKTYREITLPLVNILNTQYHIPLYIISSEQPPDRIIRDVKKLIYLN